MEKLKEILGMMPEAKTALGHAARERVAELKKLRKKMSSAGLEEAVDVIDHELELWKGTKGTKDAPAVLGILWALDVSESQEKKKKKEDPTQRDLEDKPDYRTWDLTTDGVRELIAAEISERPAVEAIRIINALEDGENEKEGGPRKSVLDVLRASRKPLVESVEKGKLSAVN